jgi:hypothetical protein
VQHIHADGGRTGLRLQHVDRNITALGESPDFFADKARSAVCDRKLGMVVQALGIE